MIKRILNWLYYLGCKTEADKREKDRREIELAIWQLSVFTR